MIGRTLLAVGALTLLCPAPRAAAPECARYFQHGLEPGMGNRDVWRAMGRRGVAEGRVRDASGPRTVERYDEGPAVIRVSYDGTVSKKATANVVSIEIAFEEALVEVPGLLAGLRERLGRPSAGAEHLESALETGQVEWADPACGVEVRLFRRPASWWEPSASAEFHVSIVGLAGRAAEPAAAPLVATGPSRGAPAAAAPPVARDEARTTEPPAVPASDPPEPARQVLVAGRDGVTSPVRRDDAPSVPRIPAAARAHVSEGQVVLRVIVREDGSVGDVQVESAEPPGLGLEQAAMRTVRRWRYDPATRDGRPVNAEILVTFSFR